MVAYNYLGSDSIKDFPPNINPELFSVIGALVGFVAEADFTANELNSIGNWIILVGQFMLTTAAQQQLINGRYQKNNGSRIKSDANDHNKPNPEKLDKDSYDKLIELINRLEKELKDVRSKGTM